MRCFIEYTLRRDRLMMKNPLTIHGYPLLFRNTVLGRTVRFGCLLIIFLYLTLLCSCFSHTGSFGDDDSDNYEHSFAVEDSDTLNDELIDSLVDYLQGIHLEYEIPDTSLSIKIDKIKKGHQPLLVDFDPTDFYFVCGYYNVITEDELFKYRNADDFTWVRFENANDIKEIHEDKKIVVAFQINKALFVRDIASKKAIIPRVEHFQMYEPIFEEGVNTNAHIVFEEEFIYLNPSNAERVYHSISVFYHQVVTISCINYDNEYYISHFMYSIHANGEKSETNLRGVFDEYYEALMSVIQPTKYSITRPWGSKDYYGLITIDDFVNIIN